MSSFNKKKIMILGAGYFQLPAIVKAKKLGYYTIVFSNILDDPGMRISDKAYNYSTTEKKIILSIAQHEKIDGIMTIASEIATLTACYVANKMKLPSLPYKAIQTISNKFKLRKFLAKNNITDIPFGLARNYKEALKIFDRMNKPVMIKPLIASGSRGVKKIYSSKELKAFIKNTINESFLYKGAIIEAYIDGEVIGGEIVINKGDIIFFKTSKRYTNNNFVPYGHILPSGISRKNQEDILDKLEKIINKLDLRDGALDFDVMLSSDGIKIIELGGRLGGNCISELMFYHTGIDIIKEVIKISIGEDISILHPMDEKPVAVYIIGSKKSGILQKIKNFVDVFPDSSNHLIDQKFHFNEGQPVNKFTQSNYQLGHFILKHECPEKLIALMDEVHKINWIEVK